MKFVLTKIVQDKIGLHKDIHRNSTCHTKSMIHLLIHPRRLFVENPETVLSRHVLS